MKHQRQGIYKVVLPLPREGDLLTLLAVILQGLEWLRENGREETFINVYKGEGKVTFVVNDLETALLMRLSLQ